MKLLINSNENPLEYMKPQPQKAPRREPPRIPRIQKGELPPFPPLQAEDLEVIPGGKLDEEITENERLVLQAQAGDNQAMDQLLQMHDNLIFGIIRKILSNDQDVKDAGQDTMKTAWEKIGMLNNAQSFKSWLGSIASRSALMILRRKKRQDRAEPTDDLTKVEGQALDHYREAMSFPDPELALLATENQRLMQQALESLSPHYREIIEQALQGKSMQQIADELNLTVANTKTRLHRARNAMKRFIDSLDEMSA